MAGHLTAIGCFLVHPGAVYLHGLPGLLGVAVAAMLGSSAGA